MALACSLDSEWRNRSEFLRGRQQIVAFLTRKWGCELEYAFAQDTLDIYGPPYRRAFRIRVA